MWPCGCGDESRATDTGAPGMIDWYLVATSGLWILGASILLAAFSYHQWLAGERGRRLARPVARMVLAAGIGSRDAVVLPWLWAV
jgi:hypothetical protein